MTGNGTRYTYDLLGKVSALCRRQIGNVTGQAHHLSQNAVFKNAIPQGDGLCVELNGNAFSELK